MFSGILGKRRHKVSNAPPDPAPGLHQLGLTREDVAVVRGLPLFQGMSDPSLHAKLVAVPGIASPKRS